jgi:hypothetical protein
MQYDENHIATLEVCLELIVQKYVGRVYNDEVRQEMFRDLEYVISVYSNLLPIDVLHNEIDKSLSPKELNE